MTRTAILGIDISKAYFDVCLLLDNRRWQARFSNDAGGFRRMAHWLREHEVHTLHACLEATGRYGEALAEWLYAAGHTVSVVNPARIKAYAMSQLRRNKTDRLDAALIADFCLRQAPAPWTPPAPEQRALQAMVRHLDALERMRTQERNRLQAGPLPGELVELLETHIHFLSEQIQQLQTRIQQHIDQHASLQQPHALLCTIKGLGALTASKLLAELPPIEQFGSARAVAAYAGLTPRLQESGSRRRGDTRLSKTGKAAIRKALYLPALSAMRHNPLLRTFAERLAARGKAPKVIVGAVMRKLLHLV